MRISMFLLAAMMTAAGASQAGAGTFDSVLGSRYRYEGPWCARTNIGAGNIVEDCRFNTFEACRNATTGGNRGFCTQNPAFTGFAPPPRNYKKKYRKHRRPA